ncbi:MAG: Alpha/beta hydrolase fold protein [Candidatus Kaiserbacteria bacterium GW2011_GWB1_52_6]|uniref:Alpha/beta hydrolase fold protein n=3 Tax=Candidatus Kaiseribacteriota TaxID=1752734 RepID=A0A0G1X8C8_9BACT|nr:MAG: Alpha/beta hydrolase fold protein [Candidatus Kaiserbacteria bacterium GW2011_GWB1_52_6]
MLPVHKATKMHPVDAYEFLHWHSQREIANAAAAANAMVGTEFFAKMCGDMVNASLAAEDFRRTFMPFVPEMPIHMMKMYSDQVVQMTAQNWSVYLDTVKGEDQKTIARRLEIWKHVLNTHYPIASSKKELVHEEGIVKLYRYTRLDNGCERKPIPLLLVFAIMNRPAVFDLYPGNSFVEYMALRGYDVYLVDWGTPGQMEKNFTFGTYALELLPKLIAKMKQLSDSETFNILGWCLGALIVSLYASLRPDEGLKKLMLLTAPLDFSDDEQLTFRKWLRHIDVEKLLDHHDGLMPAHMIEAGAQMLKPIDNGIRKYLTLWNKLDDPEFVEGWHALDEWVKMNVPIAGGAYRQLVFELYLGNKLVEGTFRLGNETAHLGNIKADVFALIAESDHITPPSQIRRAFPLIGSAKKTLKEFSGGHIGVMAGGAAKDKVWPGLDSWLQAD